MIRYDSEYNRNIARVVSNFNRKIARLQKAGQVVLPQRVSVRELKASANTRGELNRQLRDLQRFGRRGSENIVTVGGKEYTAYEVDVFRRQLRRERARLSRDIQKAESYTSKYPMQHDRYTANLKARRATISKNWNELINTKVGQNLSEQDAKQTELYDNYLEILFQDAYQIGFEDDKINYISSRLMKLKPRQFMRALEDDPNIQYIFEYYHALTRTSALGDSTAYDAFQQLYENIDAIVAKFK